MGVGYLKSEVFLGSLGAIIVLLVVIWNCLAKEMCWFQKFKPREQDEEEEEEEDDPLVRKLQ